MTCDGILNGTFVSIISAPLLALILGIGNDHQGAENRNLAPPPELRWHADTILRFPEAAKSYFNDHFGLRRMLVQAYSILKTEYLGTSPVPRVILGKNDWLYYRRSLEFHLDPPLTQKELSKWAEVLEGRKRWVEQLGAHYVFVIAPNKSSIYPEHVPSGFLESPSPTRTDQLCHYLREQGSDVLVLDLRSSFHETASTKSLYHRTDTHWNDEGAFVGYLSIMSFLRAWFPEITLLSRSDFRTVPVSSWKGDLAGMIPCFPDRFHEFPLKLRRRTPANWRFADESNVRFSKKSNLNTKKKDFLLVTTCRTGAIPRAVIFRDSFATTLQPLLSEHFARAVYIHRDLMLDTELIASERPNVVIEETVERDLPRVPLCSDVILPIEQK